MTYPQQPFCGDGAFLSYHDSGRSRASVHGVASMAGGVVVTPPSKANIAETPAFVSETNLPTLEVTNPFEHNLSRIRAVLIPSREMAFKAEYSFPDSDGGSGANRFLARGRSRIGIAENHKQ